MRAAVVGTGWGRVHVRALRQHGVEVVAVSGAREDADRTRAVANEENIPLALQDARSVLDLGVDLVSVATPARTHDEMLALFRDVPTICEKPVVGITGDLTRVPRDGAPTYINYAFSFLDTARVFAEALHGAGAPARVSIDTAYDLPLAFTGPEWFLEGASHPLSFVVHLLGAPTLVAGHSTDIPRNVTGLQLAFGPTPVEVTSRHEPGLHGIRHTIRASTAAGELELAGRFVAGLPWRFESVRLDGVPLNEGEWSPDDCWHRANVRSIGAALGAVNDSCAAGQAASAGLFTPERAGSIDRCVQEAFGATHTPE